MSSLPEWAYLVALSGLDDDGDDDMLIDVLRAINAVLPTLYRPPANCYSSFDHRTTFDDLLRRYPYEGDRWKSQFRIQSLRWVYYYFDDYHSVMSFSLSSPS